MDEFAASDSTGARPTTRCKKRRAAWIGAFAAWIMATGGALVAITAYAGAPGMAAVAPSSWPATSHLDRTPGRVTLVMIAHTKCACTRASIRELERLMPRAGDRAEAFVLFVGPREKPAIGMLDLREAARAIPGVRIVEDEREARVFGAITSGQVVLYDGAGILRFRGGITPSRGHEGSTAGGETVARFIAPGAQEAAPHATASEVFGCALFDRDSDPGARASGVGKEP